MVAVLTCFDSFPGCAVDDSVPVHVRMNVAVHVRMNVAVHVRMNVAVHERMNDAVHERMNVEVQMRNEEEDCVHTQRLHHSFPSLLHDSSFFFLHSTLLLEKIRQFLHLLSHLKY